MDVWRIAVGVLANLILWIGLRFQQKQDDEDSYFIDVPSWLSWLCGRPRLDHKLELGAMVAQVGSILAILLCLLTWPLNLVQCCLVTFCGGPSIIAILVGLIARIVARRFSRQKVS